MKLQARNFVVRKPETIDITMFFKKFCIATRTIPKRAYLRIVNVDTLFFYVLYCLYTFKHVFFHAVKPS